MRLAPPQATLEAALGKALSCAQAGDLNQAEGLLRQILAAIPEQPNALQLLGMVARQRGDQAAAAALFRRSLAAQPDQPHVRNNLGNCCMDLSRFAEAAAAYAQALAQNADYTGARLNLALAQIALQQPAAAQTTLQPEIRAHPENARAWAILGRALQDLGSCDRAIDAYHTALRLRPGHLPWRHNLAVLWRLVGRAQDALPILADCAAQAPDNPAIHYNLGHCLQDLGRVDDAAGAYRQAIQLAQTDVTMHESLSRLLWENGQMDRHLESYHLALADHPDHPALVSGLANRLTLAGQPQQAARLLAPLVARGAGDAGLDCQLGQALWSGGDPDQAMAAFDGALSRDPDHAAALCESARALLILDRPQDALPRVLRRLASNPFDQQALALQGIAWRLLGDARAIWLNDPSFIGCFALSPGGEDKAGFHRRLDCALDPLHTGRHHPLEQTLRGGTQTADDLFRRDLPLLSTARRMIEEAVRGYIDSLTDDPDHPFLGRKSANFAFSGSWSVRLHSDGYHRNHIHPAGWISAVYYVALPDAVAHGQQGWLTFGETGLNMGPRERTLCTVRPEPGLLVLFPSYFYHGTIPFADTGHRTTIAFDIVPAENY